MRILASLAPRGAALQARLTQDANLSCSGWLGEQQ
jgi:hypothetical protein